jgi:hypothetical protein
VTSVIDEPIVRPGATAEVTLGAGRSPDRLIGGGGGTTEDHVPALAAAGAGHRHRDTHLRPGAAT